MSGSRRRDRRRFPAARRPRAGVARASAAAGASRRNCFGGSRRRGVAGSSRYGGQAGRGGRGAAAPPKPQDAHVLKFSRKGEFLLQIGKAGAPGGNDSTTALNRPAGVTVDTAANEVYVADGFGNRRVVVFDATTGAYKRHWGAATGDSDRSQSRQLRARWRRTARSTSAIAATTASGLRQDRQAAQAGRRLGDDARHRIGLGRRVLERCAAAFPVRRRRPRSESVHPPARHARDRRQLRRRRPLPGYFPQRRQRRGGLERQRLHRRDARGKRLQKFIPKGARPMMPTHARERIAHRPALRRRAGRARARRARRRARGRRPGERRRHGAPLRSRSAVAEAAAQSLGARPDDRPRHRCQDHVWIVHRANRSAPNEAAASRIRPPPRAASRRRRCSSSIRRATWSATGAVRARATTGRSRITASRSITRATSGSAATSAPTRTS